ncbi:type II secretion system protein GspG [Paraburkholderia dipogonis]|uniref:type II secretion system protein GspG n=1 Tax=Paraburkholderia dipogonis TaxID=1211383 RepID=UPI0035F0C31C
MVWTTAVYPTPGARLARADRKSRARTRCRATGKDGGYLERLPNDPWGNAYQFLNPGVHGEIDVFSYGADGKAGGEGNDADVGSWQ